MANEPKSLTIRTYNVGFGDCFLLNFQYDGGKTKHVLIDFGSTGLPPGTPNTRMMAIANDIREQVGAAPLAVVATHRHKDHISGFETKPGGKGSGDVIAGLNVKLVVQPWTEDPDLETTATGPKTAKMKKMWGSTKRVAALASMQSVAGTLVEQIRATRHFPKPLKDQLSFLGEDNISNLSAIKNLQKMARNVYAYAGSKSGLDRFLPGVRVHVLGPPTVEQSEKIKTMASKDPDEFWHLQARAMRLAAGTGGAGGATSGGLFPRHIQSRGSHFPIEARWLVYRARMMKGDQLLQIVRMLDKQMNNTSLILVFEARGQRVLFPGDAQLENWQFALSKPANLKLLSGTNLYKVGHHGSLNATPKSLWKLFERRSKDTGDKKRLKSLMSTMEGKHGSEANNTEVPRRPLVQALERESTLFSTQMLKGGAFFSNTQVF